jgi:NCS1 family nucleobase:cation symporter-1
MKLSPHPAVMVILLLFVLLAQFSTNLILNIMPSSLIFMERFKMSWGAGVILSAVLAVASCPWFILGNMEAYFAFIAYYSSFFGPVLGVMLADYWVVRKQKYNLEDLYTEGPEGACWFTNGFNRAGLISIFVPAVITMLWFLPASWLVGLPLGFVSYSLLAPVLLPRKP